MKYLKIFENFDSPQGCGCCSNCTGESDCNCGCTDCTCQESDKFEEFKNWLDSNKISNQNIGPEFKNFFTEITDKNLSSEEKAHEIAAYLDEKLQLYDRYIEVVDYLDELLSE